MPGRRKTGTHGLQETPCIGVTANGDNKTKAQKFAEFTRVNRRTFTEPAFVEWSVEEVGEWISREGYPHYAPCFVDNLISGRRLVLFETDTLIKIGIKIFEDVKAIAKLIRDLVGLPPDVHRKHPADRRVTVEVEFLERRSRHGSGDNLVFEKTELSVIDT